MCSRSRLRLYRRHGHQYRQARTTLLIATGLALVVYMLIPTAPPRLLPGGNFHDIVAHSYHWGWWSGKSSDAPRGLGSAANQLAAMPSMHAGWSLWSGWLIVRNARSRVVKVLGAAYPIMTALVIMGTANHYFAAVVGGVVAIGVGAAISHVAYAEARRARADLLAPSAAHHRAGSPSGWPSG
jgi:hypothetical protein